jgi:hypothetical protein
VERSQTHGPGPSKRTRGRYFARREAFALIATSQPTVITWVSSLPIAQSTTGAMTPVGTSANTSLASRRSAGVFQHMSFRSALMRGPSAFSR